MTEEIHSDLTIVQTVSSTGMNSKDFNCPFENCSKPFPDKEALLLHFKTHVYKKCYHCNFPECTKTFLSQINLKKHARKHIKKKIYLCEFPGCGQEYNQICHLTTHHRIHKGYRPYKCNQCPKTFMEKSFLNTHMRCHTGELAYKCKACSKSFKVRQELNNHQEVVHGDTKPFVCLKCKASFSKYNALKVHQKIHAGQKPYTCPYPGCGKSFVEKGNMKTHFKIHDNFQQYLDLIDDVAILKQSEVKSESEFSDSSSKKLIQDLKTNQANTSKIEDFNKIFASLKQENECSTASSKLFDDYLASKQSIIQLLSINQTIAKMQEFSAFLDSYASTLINTGVFFAKFQEMVGIMQEFNSTGCYNDEVNMLKSTLYKKVSSIMMRLGSICGNFGQPTPNQGQNFPTIFNNDVDKSSLLNYILCQNRLMQSNGSSFETNKNLSNFNRFQDQSASSIGTFNNSNISNLHLNNFTPMFNQQASWGDLGAVNLNTFNYNNLFSGFPYCADNREGMNFRGNTQGFNASDY